MYIVRGNCAKGESLFCVFIELMKVCVTMQCRKMYSSSGFTLFFFFFLFFPISSMSTPLNLERNFTVFGDAAFTSNAISLTQRPVTVSSSSPLDGVGRALYAYPIRFLDPKTNCSASFSCQFSFTITPYSPSSPFGDGFAFLITSDATSVSTDPGLIGLPEPSDLKGPSFIAVEFDTSFDPFLGDINDNHIGLDIGSAVSHTSVDVSPMGIDLKSGGRITAWIVYDDSTKVLKVWASLSNSRPEKPLISTYIDLSLHFKEFMHIGFCASNGNGAAHYVIENLKFRTSGCSPSLKPRHAGEGQDCLICIAGDSNKEFEYGYYADLHPRKIKLGQGAKIGIGFGALGVLLLAIVSIVLGTRWCQKWRLADGRGGIGKDHFLSTPWNSILPTRASLAEIKTATKGFHGNRVVGKGAGWTVYKGVLSSGKVVAIKRFNQSFSQAGHFGNHKPFTNELATMLGSLRHKNLVKLLGWCCEGDELVLVYEYMPRGSLEKILHETSDTSQTLSWEYRLKIVRGVASALTYLHEQCERQIIHRDVKAGNILLDNEYNTKLGDLGLAELYEHTLSATREQKIPSGTMGYLAPEYVHSGIPTEKTDVYSFGVVLLEVATGRWPLDGDGIVLVDWVWEKWAQGRLMEAVDDRLKGRFDTIQMEAMLIVGLSCVHPKSAKRPKMKEAEKTLRQEAPLPDLPPRKPEIRLVSYLPEGAQEIVRANRDPVSQATLWGTPESQFGEITSVRSSP